MSEKLKKGYLFLGTLFLAGGLYISSLNAYVTNQATLATNPAANALFVPVRNADNVAHEVGDVVVWSDNTNDGVDITTTTTPNDGLVAGVVAQSDIAAGAFGLVQVAGYHSAATTTGSVAAGGTLVSSTTGEAGAIYTLAQSTGALANEAIVNGTYAVCLAAAASNVCQAIIRAL